MRPFSLLLIIVALLSCSVEEDSTPEVKENIFLKEEGMRTLVAAHRGGSRLAPENTIAAFDSSVARNVDVLEMDVLLTSDSVLVINHDLTIDRTSDGSGGVYEHTYAELLQYNFGYHFRAEDGSYPYRDAPVRIPTLEEVLQRYPRQKMIIEIKNTGPTGKRSARALYETLEQYDMLAYACVFSFDHTVMAHYYFQNGEASYTGASIGESLTFLADAASGMHLKKEYPYEMFALPLDFQGIDLITDAPELRNAANARRIAVYYWTINDREKMEELVEMGVDGIITDRPDLLQEVISELE